jgi:hypothetical protein
MVTLLAPPRDLPAVKYDPHLKLARLGIAEPPTKIHCHVEKKAKARTPLAPA